MEGVPPVKPPVGTGSQPAAGPPTGELRGVDGLRAWVAQLDRKIGVRTYAGGAAVVLALATAIVAVVLAIDARDNSARNDDLNRIQGQLSDVSAQAGSAESAQSDIDSLAGRVGTLEDQLDAITTSGDATEKRLSVVEDDIDDLRRQISDLGASGSGAGLGGTP